MALKVNQWTTPSAVTVRKQGKAYVEGKGINLQQNDVPSALLEANSGNASLAYSYQDYLSQQLLPSTATGSYLDKWARIWLLNADGSRGRKVATYSSGTATFVAVTNSPPPIIPAGTVLYTVSGGTQVIFEVTTATTIDIAPTAVPVRSLTPGAISNFATGTTLTMPTAIQGVSSAAAIVVSITGGTDAETDDALQARVLTYLQNPPMGGDGSDWSQWCTAVPGVTRAWCAPNEVAAGTVTMRIMCDELRASTGGYPDDDDLQAVRDYLDLVRPVTVAQYFVYGPTPVPVDLKIPYLNPLNEATTTAIQANVAAMIQSKARPASAVNGTTQPPQTIYRAWISEAILLSAGVKSFTLEMEDFTPSSNNEIAVLGSIDFTPSS